MSYKEYLKELRERNKKLVALRKKNPTKWTFTALGNKFDITPQRAEQICRKEEK